METEKLQVNFAPGQTVAELIIREGQAPQAINPKPPVKVALSGTLQSVAEFLSKRVNTDQFSQYRSFILVNRDSLSLTLVINEHDEYTRGEVKGKLETNSKFKEFKINTGEKWAPSDLSKFIKMNRSFFQSKTEAMDLVTLFRNYTATINKKLEKAANDRGDKTDNFTQEVHSNLPESFKIVIPIFKGHEAETIEVEVIADPVDRDIYFSLISPGANDILESIRDGAIDAELGKIKEIAPDIVVIEQ